MTEVKAHNRYLRMSPRKVRLVVDMVRGMDVAPAIDQLKYLNKAAARPVRKLLESAAANAKHNNRIESDNLFVKAIVVNEGPTIKRWMPKAMGASGMIRKRTSHLSVTLAPKDETKVPKPEAKKEKKDDKKEEKKAAPEKKEEKKPAAKKTEKKTEKKVEAKKEEKKPAKKSGDKKK